jgi:hypothetical protein
MADERVVTPVLHIEGGNEVMEGPVYFADGRALFNWASKQGITFRTEYRREPWTEAELRRGDLESRVAILREEFPSGEYPPPMHPVDEPCAECEAIRFLESVS